MSSNKKVWWQCLKRHEWETTVNNRNSGKSCPYCAGQKVNDDNCLQTLNPSLAKEWHPTKNGKLTPNKITVSSGKKVWWQCSRGHEWEAMVNNRSKGIGCPYCHSQTSQLELRVFTEMKFLFHNAEHRKKCHGVECDVFLPDLNFGVAPIKPDTLLTCLALSYAPSVISSSTLYGDDIHCSPQTRVEASP